MRAKASDESLGYLSDAQAAQIAAAQAQIAAQAAQLADVPNQIAAAISATSNNSNAVASLGLVITTNPV